MKPIVDRTHVGLDPGRASAREINALVCHSAREAQLDVDQDASEVDLWLESRWNSRKRRIDLEKLRPPPAHLILLFGASFCVSLREPRFRQSLREKYGRPYIKTAAAIFAKS